MSDWQRVSRIDPCGQCGKFDWCGYSETHVICMRVPSERPTENGGWLHPIGGERKPRFIRNNPEPSVDVGSIYRNWLIGTTDKPVTYLAQLLQLPSVVLDMMGVAFAPDQAAWAFPMRDANRIVVGVRLRNKNGDKWAVKGGRDGLFIPIGQNDKRVFICEGPTDCAALLSIGLFAIGRASCNTGGQILCDLLPRLGVRSAVIVSDHDSDKLRPDGSTYNPGVDGAVRLSERLPVPNCIWLPPTKDAREFVRHGGTAVQIEAMIKNVRWKQPADRN